MGDLATPGVASAFAADGFALVDRLVSEEMVVALHDRFDRLFRGEFETGVPPDEVNWQEGTGDLTLTRQLCNAWRADRLVASVVLSSALGEALARLAGWPGARTRGPCRACWSCWGLPHLRAETAATRRARERSGP